MWSEVITGHRWLPKCYNNAKPFLCRTVPSSVFYGGMIRDAAITKEINECRKLSALVCGPYVHVHYMLYYTCSIVATTLMPIRRSVVALVFDNKYVLLSSRLSDAMD